MLATSGVRSLIAAMTICSGLPAEATGNFYCAGKTEHGSIALGANVDSDGKILFPPKGHIRLTIEGRDVDSNRVEVAREKTWTKLRDRENKQALLSFRRTTEAPRFVTGVDYEFCDAQNWRGTCWGAQIRYTDGNGQERIIDAVCGNG